MSRIDELISELCPDGVEFKSLGDLVEKPRSINWGENEGREFQYIDLSSVDRRTHKVTETTAVSSNDAPSRAKQLVRVDDVLFGTTRPTLMRYVRIPPELDGQICSTGFCVLRSKSSELSPGFLFHTVGTQRFGGYVDLNQQGGGYPAIRDAVVKGFRIPLPSLPIQNEIVGILDKFMELEAELEAELEERRRQYEYYRDALLTFTERECVRWVTLGEIGMLFGGLTGKAKADFQGGKSRFVSYRNVFDNLSTNVLPDDFVSIEDGEKQTMLHKGDVLFTGSSESLDESGMTSVITSDPPEPLYLNSFCIGYRLSDPQDLHPDFAKHLFRSLGLRQQIIKTASGVTRFNVSKKRLGKVHIPIPARDEQERIASVLDSFNSLVSDLSFGLPAEIAARRKQYEYYRDMLLTFDEAAA